MTIKDQNFEMYAGDSWDIVIFVSNSDGSICNLTGQTIKWSLKSPNKTVYKDIANSGITVANPIDGKFTVYLKYNDTFDLKGKFPHGAELVDTFGNISTVTVGFITIKSAII